MFYDFQDPALQVFFQNETPEEGTTYVEYSAQDLETIRDFQIQAGYSKSEADSFLNSVLGVETLMALSEPSRMNEHSDLVVAAGFDASGLIKKAYFPAIWQGKPNTSEMVLKIGKNEFAVRLEQGQFAVGDLKGEANFTMAQGAKKPDGVVKFKADGATFKVPLMIGDKVPVTDSEMEKRVANSESINEFLRSGSGMTLLRDLPAYSVYRVHGVLHTPDNPYNDFMLQTDAGNVPPNTALSNVVNATLTVKKSWAAVSEHYSRYNLHIGEIRELASGNKSVNAVLKFDPSRAQPKTLASAPETTTVNVKAAQTEPALVAVEEPF